MYSLLPALVSLLFLSYGTYVVASRGVNRATAAFGLVCLTTFAWQFAWAILFQVSDPVVAGMLAKAGYVLILFLPTTLYHFVVTLTRQPGERPALMLAYGVALLLVVVLLGSDLVVAGVHHYAYGFYPKAGRLHGLHVVQTLVVISRAAWLLWRNAGKAVSTERLRLRLCLASLLIYTLAAVDYAGNYGLPFYPPGVIFIAISLGIIARAMARHDLLANPLMLAASIAHELRTPLATLRNQTRVLAKGLPELIAGYEHGLRHGHVQAMAKPGQLDYLRQLASEMDAELTRSNFITDMLLASAKADMLDTRLYTNQSIQQCVSDALRRYPFEGNAGMRLRYGVQIDFRYFGCSSLLSYVLFNLVKNAMAAQRPGTESFLDVSYYRGARTNYLNITDNGNGIAPHVLPHIFDPYYSTRHARGGTGMGLAFCRRVMSSFGGSISCRSREGRYTTFELAFPIEGCEPVPSTLMEELLPAH
jgi:two-component system CAI-1 autoinducer sensor kinase/phosphatase CqsS